MAAKTRGHKQRGSRAMGIMGTKRGDKDRGTGTTIINIITNVTIIVANLTIIDNINITAIDNDIIVITVNKAMFIAVSIYYY